jgi:hypothetical protein
LANPVNFVDPTGLQAPGECPEIDLTKCLLNAADFGFSLAADLLGGWLLRGGWKIAKRAKSAWRWAERFFDLGKVDPGMAAIRDAVRLELRSEGRLLEAAAGYAGGVGEDLLFANNPNHMPSGSFRQFLLDVAPVIGTGRAFLRAGVACGLFEP